MDRQRLLLALLISLAILIAWPAVYRFFYPPPPELAPPPAIAELEPAPAEVEPAPTPELPPPAIELPETTDEPVREIVVSTPLWRAKFSSRGAVATSWVLIAEPINGRVREIKAAAGGELELIPQNAQKEFGSPFAVRLPGQPSLAEHLNGSTYRIEGVAPDESEVRLGPGESRDITFTFASGSVSARKTFKLFGDSFISELRVEVSSGGARQPVYIELGPRIGDQTDKLKGTYATPPQVIGFDREGDAERVAGPGITPPFATITSVEPASNRIAIEKPLASDVDSVKIVAADKVTFIGYARVVERSPDSRWLRLERLPEGTAAGGHVGQGWDTLRAGYHWAGVVDHYFGMVAVPPLPVAELILTNVQVKGTGDEPPVDFPSVAIPVEADWVVRVFVGPKDRELLAQLSAELGTDLEVLIDYGIFAFAVRPLLPIIGWGLDLFGRLFRNYGWSIVIVTVIINLALSPLRLYSSKKMKKAAKHQPRLKELQERMKKLKENPKKSQQEMAQLQQEQMAIMKEANPLGGCMPLLLQMPIFWAFFVYLTISLDVRKAPWILWIQDLSSPDPYYVLPIVMCVTMIASTMLTPMPASNDPAMKMQRIMMTWLMPIMLTWLFFFSAPSGLVLYWMVSNLVGVVIQYVINKATAEPVEAPAATGKASPPAKRGPTGKAKGKRGLTEA